MDILLEMQIPLEMQMPLQLPLQMPFQMEMSLQTQNPFTDEDTIAASIADTSPIAGGAAE